MPKETPAEVSDLMKVHNSDAMFDNFSFVNEANVKSLISHQTEND
jgi:hypothetical protein